MNYIKKALNWLARCVLTIFLSIVLYICEPLFYNVGNFGIFCFTGVSFVLGFITGWCLMEFIANVVRMNIK